MNKNIENYKKVVDEIKAPDELKQKVLAQAKEQEKAEPSKSQNKRSGLYFLRYAVGIAAVAVVALVGVSFYNQKEDTLTATKKKTNTNHELKNIEQLGIKRFESMDELRSMIEEAANTEARGIIEEDAVFATNAETKTADTAVEGGASTSDFSRTNNQVESVDEADIIKTDGKYIYYTGSGDVSIIDAESLELVANIIPALNNYSANNLFINGNKLIVLGTWYSMSNSEWYNSRSNYYWDRPVFTKAIVYDLKDIKNPKLENEFTIEGYYSDARMIDDNIYFISNKSIPYYYYNDFDEIKDDELLPKYYAGDELVTIDCTDIYYFEDLYNYSYTLIAGFNLNSDDLSIETFMGWSDEYYVNESNMYVVQTDWNYYEVGSSDVSYIYKFKLDNGTIEVVARGEVPGYVNDQFSIDEYKGNLRIVTDVATNTSTRRRWSVDYETRLTILDENLEEIGCIESLVEDERVYSVRFMGDKGYVVTFEQIDPLFTLDLSNPRNPKVIGELEIPGYSAYLHPYDEDHIIGIGYNVEDNGYGGYTNGSMKMSMFDVSDLKNPKELFSIEIGQGYASSEIIYDHKALFYKESENLIGFPVNWWDYSYDDDFDYYSSERGYGLALFKIDMDNEKFIEIDDLIGDDYSNDIIRAIYIDDTIYTVSWYQIVAYDMNTYEKIDELTLKNSSDYDVIVY